MEDNRQTTHEQPNKEPPAKKRGRFLLRVLLFLLALALILAAVGAVVFRDSVNMDSLKRWFHYRSLMRSDSGRAEEFLYDGDLTDTFAVLDGDLLICSSNTISLYSGSGTRYVSRSVSMENPVVDTNGSLAVVYDAGGSSLYVLGQRELIWSSEVMDTILSARLNENGQLTVVTQASGYRGRVTVYDAAYQPFMSVNLSSAYVMDADLSDDGKTLAIVTIGQEDGSFTSTLSLYEMNAAASGDFTPDRTHSLGSSVVLECHHTAEQVWIVTDSELFTVGHDGKTQSADWSDLHLKRYTLSGSDFAAILLGKYRAGSQAELWTLDADGQIRSMNINEQVLSLSAAGRYVAVLTGDRLDIYTADLELYSTLDGTRGARTVLLMEDGSAILISADNASFYVP